MKLFTFSLICLLSTVFFPGISTGQIVLSFEKASKTKTQKYFIGDEITYRKAGDEEFREGKIARLIENDSIVVLDQQYVKLREIAALRTYNNRVWSRRLGNQLYGFAGGWLLFTAGDELISSEYTSDWEMAAWVSGTSILTGILIQTIFKKKTHKLGASKRLRILNLNPGG